MRALCMDCSSAFRGKAWPAGRCSADHGCHSELLPALQLGILAGGMADGSIAVYSAQKLAHGAGDKALLHRETTKHRTPVRLGSSLATQ